MYSQCPDCQTRFRVTADDLRAARGTVRCGRCGSAFDALERLSDTVPPASREVPRLPMVVAQGDAAGTEPALATEYHFTLEDLERVFVEGGKWSELPSSTPAGAAQLPEPPATAEPPVVVDEGPAMEDITLEGERISIEAPPEPAAEEVDLDTTNEVEILRTVPASAAPEEEPTAAQVIELETAPSESALEMVEPQPEPAGAPYAAEPAPVVPAEPRPLSAQRWRRPVEEREEAVAPAPAAARPGALGWALASAALALVLAVQLVHYFRADLARHPQVGPPLRGVYQRLGLALQPHWDVGAIELRQWGNDADAAARGGMAVRASLTNRAAFAQPHPILRLELEDRFGATVATRDFEPADYLKNPSQAARLMAPGASSEAELLLADPGRDAVGYRLDVCLRESPTQLRCASGPG